MTGREWRERALLSLSDTFLERPWNGGHLMFMLIVGQVTSLLLESERRKLSVLQRDLRGALNTEAGSLKAKERQQHELNLAIS